jgi:hypothetical protein
MIIVSHNIVLPANNHRANANEHGDKNVSAVEKSDKNNDVDDPQVKKDEKSPNEKGTNNKHEGELDEQELSQLRTLQNRDREVRAHEQAHIAAAGSLAKGGASFEYKRVPDGQRYAVGGEVQIDTSTVSGDPEATAAKAQQIRRAALAPAQPSQQDRSVAAASTMEAKARIEIAQQKTESAVEKLNNEFSGEEDKVESEKGDDLESTKSSEVTSKCPQCGGQHSCYKS